MTTALVAGAIAGKPGQGGEAWVRLNWVLGLRRLGLDVHLVEQVASASDDAIGYFRAVTEAFGLAETSSLLLEGNDPITGPPLAELVELAGEADLLVNVSGNLRDPRLFDRVRRRVYVDLDPGFTQFWHAQGLDVGRLVEHERFYTVGANVGREGCLIPTGGIPWRAIAPPVVLEHWPAGPPPVEPRFTTVAVWRGAYGPVEHEGRRYGLKLHEFRKLVDLPRLVPEAELEIALAIEPADAADREALLAGGWRLVDPAGAAADPEAYGAYVRGSLAELSPAQGIYVDTRSGWISDRTAVYLASGRPAVVQDTGQPVLPVGEGLLTFDGRDSAAACVREVLADPERHAAAARRIAEEYLDSDLVLGRFLEEVLA